MGKTKKARRKYDRPSCISFLYNIIQHLKEKVKQSGQLFSKQDKIFDFYR